MSSYAAQDHDCLDQDAARRILADMGVTAFRWNAGDDSLLWSHHSASTLGIREEDLPRTARAFNRLLTAESSGVRTPKSIASLESPGLLGDGRYKVRYGLKPQVVISGLPCQLEEHGRWIIGTDGVVVGAEGVIRPVAVFDQQISDAKSTHDPVTGIMQRDSLLAALDITLVEMRRDRQGSAGFMVIAIDDLTRINANFGYETGDRIILAVAQRISRRMRNGDTLGHISGHKFGAIIRNCSETALAVAADRFRAAIDDELIVTPDAEVQASISIGAVVVPRYASDADTAALRAEECLSEVKAHGRGGFKVYSPSPERDIVRRRNLELANEIVRGLARNRFVLAYQPVVDARTRRIISYEALSRLVTEDGTVISAGPLIATAERLGLVKRIDERTLQLVLADLDENPDLKLAVNVSVETVIDPVWFATLVEAIRTNRGIAPRLTVEFTETAAMNNLDQMANLSQTLRDLGCKVAIDDFGTGHTSFNTLRMLSFDWLKIDGSYIRDLKTNPDSQVFTRTLVSLANHFGIRTVAEWVQDEESAEVLAALGVDALQGRLAGDPMLRVTALTEAVLVSPGNPPPRAPAGEFSFTGLSRGPLGVGQVKPAASAAA
ncbi:bifunctional diguanylate cyclase/phosphodiesterase [Chthonobacter albigriseus]|uniref:bifunctional diguanylate cyclase/phosphodiesterase n=1 Tax=Chthonobacter albigriseus TaxID=1683161 RepID=UPI0015EEB9A0|nr:bifunctional diguanylate cyclase/phosphodiesterase [Chthonobacter albigriseus]